MSDSRPVERVLAALGQYKHTGTNKHGKPQYEARCPSHDDRNASLCVSEGEDGRALIHCQAGCSQMQVSADLGLRMADLFPPKADHASRRGRIVAEYNYTDAAGQLLYQVVRFDPKDFRQRQPDGNGGWVWNLNGVDRVLYRLPELLTTDPNHSIFVVEGEKDVDNLRALGLPATCNPGGAGKWDKLADDVALHGHPIVIIADKDKSGKLHAFDVARRLKDRCPSIKIIEAPDGCKDASDWIQLRHAKAADIFAAAMGADDVDLANAPSPETLPPSAPAPAGSSERSAVIIDTDEQRVIDETVRVLSRDVELYQRGGVLVRAVRDTVPRDGIFRDAGSPTIQSLPTATLRERMTRLIEFRKVNSKGEEVPTHPTGWLVDAVDARAEWPGIKPMMAVSDVPILRSDGSVWDTPGYDEATGVLYEPGAGERVTIPADIDVPACLAQIDEIVCDFKFQTPAHKSSWIAGLITPLARFAFTGPAPMFLIDANVRGAGKSLLAQVIGRVVLGRDMPVSSYTPDADEMRKKITSLALAGDRVVLLDNLIGAFGSDVLDRALTSTRWRDRVLGKSEQCDMPMTATWYATGNNVAVAADTTRRCLHIRLDVLEEKPENRTGFRHPNLLAWAGENRAPLVAAGVGLVAAYLRAGRPAVEFKPFGSFEGWSHVIRSALVWAGLPDPCETQQHLAESSDTTADNLSQLVAAWQLVDWTGNGIVVAEMMRTLYPAERQYAPQDDGAVAMRNALEAICSTQPGKTPTVMQVSNRLRQYRRRVIDGMYLDLDGTRTSTGYRWRLYASESTASPPETTAPRRPVGVG